MVNLIAITLSLIDIDRLITQSSRSITHISNHDTPPPPSETESSQGTCLITTNSVRSTQYIHIVMGVHWDGPSDLNFGNLVRSWMPLIFYISYSYFHSYFKRWIQCQYAANFSVANDTPWHHHFNVIVMSLSVNSIRSLPIVMLFYKTVPTLNKVLLTQSLTHPPYSLTYSRSLTHSLGSPTYLLSDLLTHRPLLASFLSYFGCLSFRIHIR